MEEIEQVKGRLETVINSAGVRTGQSIKLSSAWALIYAHMEYAWTEIYIEYTCILAVPKAQSLPTSPTKNIRLLAPKRSEESAQMTSNAKWSRGDSSRYYF
jgi:hypothetical protein